MPDRESAPIEASPNDTAAAVVLPASPTLGPAELYMATLAAESSRRTCAEALRRVTRILTGQTDPDAWRDVPWATLRAKETTLVQAALVEDHSAATARTSMSMLRGVLRQAYRLGLMTAEERDRALDLSPIKSDIDADAVGRMLSEAEIDKLSEFLTSVPGPRGAMVSAIFAAALGAGLRREELARLRADQLESDNEHLRVIGKGSRERLQPLPPWVGAVLRQWVTLRGDVEDPAMFLRSPGRRDIAFTPKGIYRMIKSVGHMAGLDAFTPHDLRRTFASRMMARGDLSIAQKLMGHRFATTTVRYDRRGTEAAEKAVAGLEGWGMEKLVKDEEQLKAEMKIVDVPTVTHAVTGQQLVDRRAAQEMKRRIVKVPDFTKDGGPCDVAWLSNACKKLYLRGRSIKAIVAALNAIDVRRGDGKSLTDEDVRRLVAKADA